MEFLLKVVTKSNVVVVILVVVGFCLVLFFGL